MNKAQSNLVRSYKNLYLKSYEKNKLVLVRENGHLIWNGLIASKDTELFSNILNFYKKFPKLATKLTGPLILSMHVYRKYGAKLNNSNIKYFDSRDIDPYSETSMFNYNGLGSWGKNKIIDVDNREKTGAHHYFHRNALKFEKGFSKSWIMIRWFLKHYMIVYAPYIKIKLLFHRGN